MAPGAYTEYVRANGAKSAKSVSAKPDKDPRTPLADFFNRPTVRDAEQSIVSTRLPPLDEQPD